MKIIISSLQVSRGASKGHLHPAVEIGLALKNRGHQVTLLPLPSRLADDELAQVNRCGLGYIEPQLLPEGILYSPEELGKLAKNSDTAMKAYESFLISPLKYQFDFVLDSLKETKPDILIYDLLVYAAPLAARSLNIPDIGYCAGLKLIAPPSLTRFYQFLYQELNPKLQDFLAQVKLSAHFHHLELLSTTHQMIFTSKKLIGENQHPYPPGTICVGPLPTNREDFLTVDSHLSEKAKGAIILCFGSALDPAEYPDLTKIIIRTAQKLKRHLIISSQNLMHLNSSGITVLPYLPLPSLLKQAAILIHHGGANTFAEALSFGTPQLLIPLTTDQPIQAYFLQTSQAGITLTPREISEEKLLNTLLQLLNPENHIHEQIQALRDEFQQGQGGVNAAILVEQMKQLPERIRRV